MDSIVTRLIEGYGFSQNQISPHQLVNAVDASFDAVSEWLRERFHIVYRRIQIHGTNHAVSAQRQYGAIAARKR